MNGLEALDDRVAGKGSTPVEQRRRYVRFPCKLRAARAGENTETIVPTRLARVLNISRGGIGLHIGERIEVGALLTLQLYTSLTQPVSSSMEIRVLHASRQADGTWLLGAEFTTQLTETELKHYLS
jgi:c-di-GMP-binding flagellar brake protein YcgR